jgi:hypothetical protein
MKTLSFLQLIGSPIVAIIQAEAMAARASAEFIENVGFVKQDDKAENSYGRLRTVTFSYTKQDVNGRDVEEEVELPLLSLIPIPLLQIKDAQLSFNLKVIETVTETAGQKTASARGFDTSGTERPVSLMAVYKPVTNTTDNIKSDTDMKVSVNLVQSDIPAGLQHLFQIMENAATSKQPEKSVRSVATVVVASEIKQQTTTDEQNIQDADNDTTRQTE